MIQVFFLEGTEYSKLNKTLNNELENFTKCLNANRLTVNIKKIITGYFTLLNLKLLVKMLLCKIVLLLV